LAHLLAKQAYLLVCKDNDQELVVLTVKGGHMKAFLELYKHGVESHQAYRLIVSAAEEGHANLLEFLWHKQNNSRTQPLNIFTDALSNAAARGQVEVVRFLLSQHPEMVNSKGRKQRRAPTALHQACIGGSVEVVRLLIGAGAELFDSALELAIKHGHVGKGLR